MTDLRLAISDAEKFFVKLNDDDNLTHTAYGSVKDGVGFRKSYRCHYFLRETKPGSTVVWTAEKVIEAINKDYRPGRDPKQPDKWPEYQERFNRWLCDPVLSPWRSVISNEPLLVDGLDVNSFETRKKFWVFTDTKNIPANLLQNFMIATRLDYENPRTVELWCNLVDNGCHPGFAMFFCQLIDDYKNVRQQASVDSFVEVTNVDEQYIRNFSLGLPVNPSKSFFEAPDEVVPCNNVWGSSVWTANQNGEFNQKYGYQTDADNSYQVELVKRYPDLFEKRKGGSWFNGLSKETYRLKDLEKSFVSLVKQETDRIMNMEFKEVA